MRLRRRAGSTPDGPVLRTRAVPALALWSFLGLLPAAWTPAQDTPAPRPATPQPPPPATSREAPFAASDRLKLSEPEKTLLEMTNPLTRRPYTERQAKRIQYLRQKFPDNSLLPGPLDRDERAGRDAAQREEARILRKMSLAEASAGEVRWYYARRERQLLDWLELVDFVRQEDSWDRSTRARYDRMHTTALQEVEALRQRLDRSLVRLPEEAERTVPDGPGKGSVVLE